MKDLKNQKGSQYQATFLFIIISIRYLAIRSYRSSKNNKLLLCDHPGFPGSSLHLFFRLYLIH